MTSVHVGLSGGVDSAVSAALLQQQGFTVTGVFIKIWSPEFIECTSKEDRIDAMRVCAALEIPYKEIDLSETYRQWIIRDMVESYARGETPNPDVLCNRIIKFGAFKHDALHDGADLVATGHYARIESNTSGHSLLRGVDRAKDQSYFLHALNQEDLSRTLFPIGGFEKSHVRKLAQKFKLPVARKHDSQGLCFAGAISLKEFLSHFVTLKPGIIENESQEAIGEHEGAMLYTIGQRSGLTIGGPRGTSPHYVVSVDTARNVVVVSSRKEDALKKLCTLHSVHWISGKKHEGVMTAQARYRETPVSVTLRSLSRTKAHVVFDEPHLLSPGQSLVLFDGEHCLGGGIISVS